LLREINRQREEMRVLVTHGLDEATLETMTEALLTMKTTLTHDVHPVRRYGAADAEAREIA
jgi:ABC-type taurine transport system ATPase subunit